MKSDRTAGGLVYSTEGGRMCPVCRQPVTQCRCQQNRLGAGPSGDGIVRVRRETKGRGGKSVTVITGLPFDTHALIQFGKQLKAACGSGGTVRDGVIEVQGDHCDKVMALLQAQRYQAKRAGG